MADRYQSSGKKSTKKFEVRGRKEVAVPLPLPLAEGWEELQFEVERLTGLAIAPFLFPRNRILRPDE